MNHLSADSRKDLRYLGNNFNEMDVEQLVEAIEVKFCFTNVIISSTEKQSLTSLSLCLAKQDLA